MKGPVHNRISSLLLVVVLTSVASKGWSALVGEMSQKVIGFDRNMSEPGGFGEVGRLPRRGGGQGPERILSRWKLTKVPKGGQGLYSRQERGEGTFSTEVEKCTETQGCYSLGSTRILGNLLSLE